MDIIVVLICISLTIAIGFLMLFVWSIKSGQYEDTTTPAIRILFEDNAKESGELEGEVKPKRKK